MKTKLFTIVLLLSFSGFGGALKVHAQEGELLGCDRALSTSGLQSCLKKRLEQSQSRLQKAYDALDKKFDDDENRAELKDLQQTWLRYRDQECMWESEQAALAGLKNIHELSCMVRVTNDRVDLLEITYMDIDPDIARDYADTSRWKNLINTKYSDVFWDLENQQEADLNCNDADEIILTGVAFSKVKGIEKEGVPLYEQEQVLAVIQNPAIGTAEATTFNFKSSKDEETLKDNSVLCDSKLKIEVSAPVKEEVTEDNKEKSCDAKITIVQSKCDDKIIEWDGKNFSLLEPVLEETDEKETKAEKK